MSWLLWVIAALAIYLLVRWLGPVGRRHAVAKWGGPRLQSLDGLNRLFCRKFHRLQPDLFSLPQSGGVVVVANHISGLDPVAMIAASPRPLRFLIAAEQFNRIGLRKFFGLLRLIPVDRTGRPDKALRAALRALEAGDVVAIYPQGGITLKKDKQPRLKRGAIFLSDQTGAPIVTLRISGVTAKGLTIPAIFVRSKVIIEQGPTLTPDLPADERLQAIADFITPGVYAKTLPQETDQDSLQPTDLKP